MQNPLALPSESAQHLRRNAGQETAALLTDRSDLDCAQHTLNRYAEML